MNAALGFFVGLVLGSFVEAAAKRVLKKESLKGRSYCPSCKHKLGWYDLFPVLSFILLRGKCRYCRKPIPSESLWVELVFGLVTAVLFFTLPPLENWPLQQFVLRDSLFYLTIVFKLFVVCVLGIVFLTDLRTGLIPDAVTYPASSAAFIYLIISSGLDSLFFYQNLLNNPLGKYLMSPYSGYFTDSLQRIWASAGWSVVGALGVSSFFALLIVLTRGKGMGWGDVKYAVFLGLALGFPSVLAAVFLAFLSGAVFSLGLIVLRKKRFGQTVPFGPFLSLGAFLTLLWGNQIIDWYLSFSLGS